MDLIQRSDLMDSRDIKKVKLDLIKVYTESVLRDQSKVIRHDQIVEFSKNQKLDRLAS